MEEENNQNELILANHSSILVMTKASELKPVSHISILVPNSKCKISLRPKNTRRSHSVLNYCLDDVLVAENKPLSDLTVLRWVTEYIPLHTIIIG